MVDGIVTLDGVTTDEHHRKVKIILIVGDRTWQSTEPDQASHVFRVKNGVWMKAVNVVTLFKNDARTRVGQLKPLVPENAAPGQIGEGSSFETATDFDWIVL